MDFARKSNLWSSVLGGAIDESLIRSAHSVGSVPFNPAGVHGLHHLYADAAWVEVGRTFTQQGDVFFILGKEDR